LVQKPSHRVRHNMYYLHKRNFCLKHLLHYVRE
jgi:hypothetical protein